MQERYPGVRPVGSETSRGKSIGAGLDEFKDSCIETEIFLIGLVNRNGAATRGVPAKDSNGRWPTGDG